MLKVFNSMQFVGCFMAAPHVIAWLSSSPFYGANIAMYTAIVAYAVMSFVMTACVVCSVDKL